VDEPDEGGTEESSGAVCPGRMRARIHHLTAVPPGFGPSTLEGDLEGPTVDTASRFAKALDAESSAHHDDPDLLPVRLARAAAAVLPVDGAGLSIHRGPDLRTPLAASSEVASLAESLQFTTGAGPCLLAAESRYPVFATEAVLARRWPLFHDLLVTRTPMRSVLALCLPEPLRGVAGMDLFRTDPDGATAIDVFQARLVAGMVAERLGSAGDWSPWPSIEEPLWVRTPAARHRSRLWMAVGMVMSALQVPFADGLALLRAHAYATDRTADDLAADLVARRIRPDQLGEDADGDR
jgi:hypothetical protein